MFVKTHVKMAASLYSFLSITVWRQLRPNSFSKKHEIFDLTYFKDKDHITDYERSTKPFQNGGHLLPAITCKSSNLENTEMPMSNTFMNASKT